MCYGRSVKRRRARRNGWSSTGPAGGDATKRTPDVATTDAAWRSHEITATVILEGVSHKQGAPPPPSCDPKPTTVQRAVGLTGRLCPTRSSYAVGACRSFDVQRLGGG